MSRTAYPPALRRPLLRAVLTTSAAAALAVAGPAAVAHAAGIPVITSISPASSPLAPGAFVVTGDNLSSVLDIDLYSASAGYQSTGYNRVEVSDHELRFEASFLRTGNYQLTISTESGSSDPDASANDTVDIYSRGVTTLTPDRGPIQGGNLVVLSNDYVDFAAVATANFGDPLYGGPAAEIVSRDADSITLRAPNGYEQGTAIELFDAMGTMLNDFDAWYTWEGSPSPTPNPGGPTPSSCPGGPTPTPYNGPTPTPGPAGVPTPVPPTPAPGTPTPCVPTPTPGPTRSPQLPTPTPNPGGPTPTATPKPVVTPTPVPGGPTPTPAPGGPTPTVIPTVIISPKPTATPSATTTPPPTPKPTTTATPNPTAVPTVTPKPTTVPTLTPKPTAVPTVTPKPTVSPKPTPTPTPVAAPRVTHVFPGVIAKGKPSVVLITGTGFRPVTTVKFGTTSGKVVLSTSQALFVQVPALAAGTYAVTVTSAGRTSAPAPAATVVVK